MSPHAPDLTGATRSFKGSSPHHDEPTAFVSLSDITEIELLILRRMRNVTIGDHRSLSHGSGFDFVGLRDWQAGDRFSTIDWAQSTLTNFSPLVVREFEQPSTASVVVVADASLSTRCGVNGIPIAKAIARAIATVGHVGGLLPGPVRPVDLRRVGSSTFPPCGRASARARSFTASTRISTGAACRKCGRPAA